MIKDKRLETHIPYIEDYRIPYRCFGDFENCKGRCWKTIEKACKNKRFDLIEWRPIIGSISKAL